MQKLIEIHGSKLAWLIILLAGLTIFLQLPNVQDYRGGADEGTYYGYGKQIVDHGFGGFADMAREFVATPASQHPPNPLRIGTTVATALALEVNDSYRSLSLLSLLSFLLMLASTWWFASRHWNRSLALTALLLLAVSPLQLAMARRALMDSLAMTAAAVSVFFFFRLLESTHPRRVAGFVAIFTFAILAKETALFLLPFYAAILCWQMLDKRSTANWPILFVVLGLPPALAGLAYLGVYGLDTVMAILRLLPERSAYDAIWEQGPWYRYLIDYLMLSPYTLILAIAYVGHVLIRRRDRASVLMVCLAVYLLLAYAPLTKNVRYCLLLDIPVRILAAGMLLTLSRLAQVRMRHWWQQCNRAGNSLLRWMVELLPAVALLLLMAGDVSAFQRYFVVGAVYDPISYNLLEVNRIVPAMTLPENVSTNAASTTLASARARALQQADAENLLALGYEYCAAGLPLECSWASREATRLAPDDAKAFNNLCAAYNGLHDWPKAIDACHEALRLDPGFTLAQNNLAWAMSQAGTK